MHFWHLFSEHFVKVMAARILHVELLIFPLSLINILWRVTLRLLISKIIDSWFPILFKIYNLLLLFYVQIVPHLTRGRTFKLESQNHAEIDLTSDRMAINKTRNNKC